MFYKEKISHIIGQAMNLPAQDILSYIEIPPNPVMGDYSYPCFRHSKVLRKSPDAIALELKENIENETKYFEKTEAAGGYLNFFVDNARFAKTVLEEIIKKKDRYGSSDIGQGKTVCIDFSSPNIAKHFHVGHLRSTVIGRALYNLYEDMGYKAYGINHLGDWGTQFGKLIVAYKKWGDYDTIERSGITELNRLYILFHDEAEEDESLNDEAREWFVKMEQGDEEALRIWKWLYDLSMKEFEKIYDLLDVKFDANTGESFYNDKMDAVIQELDEKNMLSRSKGALIVDLEEYDMPPCLIKRSDGATLYITRDLATAFYRKKAYDFDVALYVVGMEQVLHFSQLFKIIKLMGYEWADTMVHVPFGMVSLEDGRLSTRKGRVILMQDLLNEAIKQTEEIIESKNPDLPDKEQVARDVGIGSVVFNDLLNNRTKDVVFSWERILNFDGETGPYVQYSHARACSVLKKFDYDLEHENIDYDLIKDDYSLEVCKMLALYPEKIKDSVLKNEPSVLTRHLVILSHSFNKFYNENYILNQEKDMQIARLAIVFAVKTVLKKGLSLLGIKAPAEM